jgi:hypothetical protein
VDPRTRNTIQQIQTGIAAFRASWGVYPPSGAGVGAAKPYGFENLAYYLMGPEGRGWGSGAGNHPPFGGSNPPGETWGPYFEAEEGAASGTPPRILDSFNPPKPILYFRAEPGRDPLFSASDNPIDPAGETGFASQAHFEMLAKERGPAGKSRWAREDYLLISPGRDRLYGHVVRDKKTGRLRPALPEEMNGAPCDDITNFSHE